MLETVDDWVVLRGKWPEMMDRFGRRWKDSRTWNARNSTEWCIAAKFPIIAMITVDFLVYTQSLNNFACLCDWNTSHIDCPLALHVFLHTDHIFFADVHFFILPVTRCKTNYHQIDTQSNKAPAMTPTPKNANVIISPETLVSRDPPWRRNQPNDFFFCNGD